MKKFLASASAALLIAAGGVAITTTAANATTSPEVCTPAEAWTETIVVTPEIPAVPAVPAVPEQAEVSHFDYQRYSWIGGPTETAPVEVPPSDNWQANSVNYEGAGHGTDPIGSAFPKNDSGKGDWFFWTKTKVVDKPFVAGTPEIPGKPAVPAVTQTVEHPAVTCETEQPSIDPVVCSKAGDWYTEGDDLAPEATPAGLVFAGGSGKAVGYRLPVTGNLQGWTSASFDATGGTEQFFFRIVIDASADGGPAYKSLSFPGTTTINQDSVSYQYGETLAATAERFPNNKITSVGFQTNSGAPADFAATLSSFSSDCANANFTYVVMPEKPEPILGVDTRTEEPVCADPLNGTAYIETWARDYKIEPVFNEETWAWEDGTEKVYTTEWYLSHVDTVDSAECAAVVVIPEPTPTETPTATPVPVADAAVLASTGGEVAIPLLWMGGAVVAMGALAVILTNIRRRKENSTEK